MYAFTVVQGEDRGGTASDRVREYGSEAILYMSDIEKASEVPNCA